MSLLNLTNDGLPNVLVMLHAHVLRTGQRGMAKGTLLDTVAPSFVVEDGQAMARQTLNSWLATGLFREQEGLILTAPFPSGVRSASATELRNFTRRAATQAVLSPHSNVDLWGTTGAADLTRALAWMMVQDAYRHGFGQFEELEAEQIADSERLLFRNSTRLNGLRYWARFLGFSRDPYADIDPTVALRDALPEIMGAGEALSAGAFLDRLATVLPVLDGGRWQAEILANLAQPPHHTRTAGAVSPALSRALLNLRASQELQLRRRSDSGSFMVLYGASGPRADLTFHEVVRQKEGAR